ncbi:unnamed protein product, partial [Sphacelaria rigidula]
SNHFLRKILRPGRGDVAMIEDRTWISATREALTGGFRLLPGTRKAVFSALRKTFASHTSEENGAPAMASAAPVTLGTLNMTGHQGWEDVFVPEKLAE